MAEKSNLEFKNTVKTCMVPATYQSVPHQEWRLNFNRISNWKRLLTVIGWVKRFIQNSRSVNEQKGVGQLNPAEMDFKSSRKKYFKQEYENLKRGSNFISEISLVFHQHFIGRLKHGEF